MLSPELTTSSTGSSPSGAEIRRRRAAAARLRSAYTRLASRRQHLLGSLLNGEPPVQWQHYPENDAIDQGSGYQWFYHSHAPEDRPGTTEHGHFHLFARRRLWARRLNSVAEKHFAQMTRSQKSSSNTRHLITIGLNAHGLPVSLFTVNSWVTGDLMLSASLTEELLASMRLRTGYRDVDSVIESVIRLFPDAIQTTLAERDRSLGAWKGENILADERLELLSETGIDINSRA